MSEYNRMGQPLVWLRGDSQDSKVGWGGVIFTAAIGLYVPVEDDNVATKKR